MTVVELLEAVDIRVDDSDDVVLDESGQRLVQPRFDDASRRTCRQQVCLGLASGATHSLFALDLPGDESSEQVDRFRSSIVGRWASAPSRGLSSAAYSVPHRRPSDSRTGTDTYLDPYAAAASESPHTWGTDVVHERPSSRARLHSVSPYGTCRPSVTANPSCVLSA